MRPGTNIPPDNSPAEDELRAEVHRLMVAILGHGCPLGVGSPAWWAAPDRTKIGSLLMLAQAYLLADPERMVTERLKAASVAISSAADWATIARDHVVYPELKRRRDARTPPNVICQSCGRTYPRPEYRGGPVSWETHCPKCTPRQDGASAA